MSLLNEFKQFALKGNVVELAVAVVIAAVIKFIIVAFALFLVVKATSKITK